MSDADRNETVYKRLVRNRESMIKLCVDVVGFANAGDTATQCLDEVRWYVARMRLLLLSMRCNTDHDDAKPWRKECCELYGHEVDGTVNKPETLHCLACGEAGAHLEGEDES